MNQKQYEVICGNERTMTASQSHITLNKLSRIINNLPFSVSILQDLPLAHGLSDRQRKHA
jgi:hypothetical protein